MPTVTLPRKTKPQFFRELKPFIAQTVSEILEDPDFGLELSAKAKARLKQARKGIGKTVAFSDIKRKYY